MIDLHTHILPEMDDGAKTAKISLKMLAMQAEQGVDTVVLTPHCYRTRETIEQFLMRRSASYQKLLDALTDSSIRAPKLLLGAEVAWVPNMADWPELPELCIAQTNNLLLELPFTPWQDQTIDQIYDLMSRRGVIPVFAHLERYLKLQRQDHIDEIIRMGTPIQLSCEPLLHFIDRRPLLKMLKNGQGHLLASDCHGIEQRRPNLKAGLDEIRKRLGDEMADQLIHTADSLVKN